MVTVSHRFAGYSNLCIEDEDCRRRCKISRLRSVGARFKARRGDVKRSPIMAGTGGSPGLSSEALKAQRGTEAVIGDGLDVGRLNVYVALPFRSRSCGWSQASAGSGRADRRVAGTG